MDTFGGYVNYAATWLQKKRKESKKACRRFFVLSDIKYIFSDIAAVAEVRLPLFNSKFLTVGIYCQGPSSCFCSWIIMKNVTNLKQVGSNLI